MAEREGFEPPVPFQARTLSRRLVSTTHPSLRAVRRVLPILTVELHLHQAGLYMLRKRQNVAVRIFKPRHFVARWCGPDSQIVLRQEVIFLELDPSFRQFRYGL